MDIVDPAVERYMRDLQARHDEPVLLEMEAHAAENDFPIVNRLVGVTLEVLARSIGARRVVELGSGFGYSAYWFSRAIGVGEDRELHLTDGDDVNAVTAADYLGRAGLDGPVTFHVGDAVSTLNGLPGEFDIVYNDIDKHGYPEAWLAARERVRVGGMYICDNVLWSGKVTDPQREDRATSGIREHNTLIAGDPDYLSTIVPTRDGVMVALRLR